VWNSHSNPNGYLYWNCKAPSPNQNEQIANGILANNNSRSIYNSALLYKKLINIHTFSSVHTSSSHLQTYLLCKIYCQDCLLTNEVEITKKLVNSIEAVKAPSLNQYEQSVKEITAVNNSKSLYNSTLHIYNQLKTFRPSVQFNSHLQFKSSNIS
jgi:hypothetical protein